MGSKVSKCEHATAASVLKICVLTFIFTVSTYLVRNNAAVMFAKLIIRCSQEVDSITGIKPEYIFVFVFFVKVFKIISRRTILSSVT